MFPLGIAGRIRIPCPDDAAAGAEAVSRKIERMLNDASATTVDRRDHGFAFTAGMFRLVWNWNVLNPFGSGEIAVEAGDREVRVSYRASTVQMLVISCAMLLIMEFFLLPRTGWTNPLGRNEHVAVVGLFAVLFSLNYLIGFIRFRGWLKRGAKQAVTEARKKRPRAADAA